MLEPFARQSLPMVVTAGLGYMICLAFLIFISPEPFDRRFASVTDTPAIAVWVSLVAAQAALWAAVACPVYNKMTDYRKYGSLLSLESVASIVILLGLFAIFLSSHRMINPEYTLPVKFQKMKVYVLSAAGFSILFLILLGMRLVSNAVMQLNIQAPSSAFSIDAYLQYRKDLEWFLAVAGVIIAGATLSTGALQRAVEILNPGQFHYNAPLVLLYGAFGTGVILLMYIPAYSDFQTVGDQICKNMLPTPGTAEELIAWQEKKQKLEGILGLNKSLIESLKTGIAILSPLVGSAVSILLGK